MFSYGSHNLQKIKVWNYKPNQPAYIYIHGGAWRDPTETYDELEPCVDQSKKYTYIGINYRLSPEIKHPHHLIDVMKALEYIVKNFQVGELHIFGFSAGATLILQLLNFEEIIELGLQADGSSKTSFPELYQLIPFIYENIKFKSIRFLDGIYNLVELIEEYSDYSSFVNDAFVNTISLPDREVSVSLIERATQLSGGEFFLNIPFCLIDENTTITIVHSLQDDLLSMRQTRLLIDFFTLKNQPMTVNLGLYGKHDEVFGDKRKALFID